MYRRPFKKILHARFPDKVRFIITLALVVGVLYCLHLLVGDYQALTAASKIIRNFRSLFKRDIQSLSKKPQVRWKLIRRYDSLQCVRRLYCGLGALRAPSDVQSGLQELLRMETSEEHMASKMDFDEAFRIGKEAQNKDVCGRRYPLCIINFKQLNRMVEFLLTQKVF